MDKSPLTKKPGPVTRPKKSGEALDLNVKGTASQFVQAIAGGAAREIACFGTRGDRKTNSAFIGMIEHAKLHAEAGFELPVKWMGVTDTFASHKLKTVRSLQLPFWKGSWKFKDDYHAAIFRIGGTDWVHVDLFGVEDQSAMDRLRMECHGVWFEEPAPAAVLVQSSGISESAWLLSLTSQRLPTHAKVAITTSNYPDEDHWVWQRFVIKRAAGTKYFRIPPGENASREDREEWARALADRPDLLRRLVSGEPGAIMLGAQVAEGFREDKHVSPSRLRPKEGEPLVIGQDFGHTPTTIIGQPWRGHLFVYAALTCDRGGIKQHFENSVIPWLATHAPWALKNLSMIVGSYDPAGNTGEETDISESPIRMVEKLLPGRWSEGPIKWEARKGLLLSALNRHAGIGELALQIDPVDGRVLIQALSGRWFYPKDRFGSVSRDLPHKPNHPWEDLGDAFIYWLAGISPATFRSGPIKVETQFDPMERIKDEISVESDFQTHNP